MAKTSSTSDKISEPKYTGVRKRKWGKWVSEIRLPNSRERIWLGSYDTPEKAARAFDAALFCLRGHNANFNFPHQPPHIPGGRSLHPSQIQAAAAHYANNQTTNIASTSSTSSLSLSLSSSEEEDNQSPSPHVSPHVQTDPWTLNDDFSYIIPDYSDVGVPDFGIYPGFDDYFMTPPDNNEDDAIYFQEPSTFLWNF